MKSTPRLTCKVCSVVYRGLHHCSNSPFTTPFEECSELIDIFRISVVGALMPLIIFPFLNKMFYFIWQLKDPDGRKSFTILVLLRR